MTSPAPTTDAVATLTSAVADLEAARTGALRVADQYAQLLRDGLHALRNGAPDVADEFMERAVAALEHSAAALRAADGRAA